MLSFINDSVVLSLPSETDDLILSFRIILSLKSLMSMLSFISSKFICLFFDIICEEYLLKI